MSKTTFIYALCEPGTRTVRYIGKSNDPRFRLKYGHLRESIFLTTHLGRWLKKVVRAGKVPALVVLAEVPRRSWKSEERRYIASARMLGMDLVNSGDGGEGVTQTPEVRKKIGDSNRGKPRSRELRKRISKTLTGRKLPKAHRLNIGKGVLGTRHGAKARRNYRLSKLGAKNPMFGKPMSETRKKQNSELGRGQKRAGASSKFRGVCWNSELQKWQANIRFKKKSFHLGLFVNEQGAARAFDAAEIRFFGSKAKLNFPAVAGEVSKPKP